MEIVTFKSVHTWVHSLQEPTNIYILNFSLSNIQTLTLLTCQMLKLLFWVNISEMWSFVHMIIGNYANVKAILSYKIDAQATRWTLQQ